MTKGNEPANPCIESINHGDLVEMRTSEGGLTKREMFAAMAMQGMCANLSAGTAGAMLEKPHNVAQWSVAFADALIAALNK